ncbi:MAG: CCA tRNA nucleotidyltransferase [Clostridia bacterium]|nr:CCA tRNA nucleotidyltransferase [Clostridia bacterium]
MPFSLPQSVTEALLRLNAHGFEAYLVGGCVRDMLMGIPPHDFDICTSALPEETMQCFADVRVIETGIKHGTVTVILHGEPLEITTFRTEGDYLDGRHPSSVAFTRSLENDLMRRDFTVNAMAYHPEKGLTDLYGGRQDIERKLLRCVGDPTERFTEDALRILRALRFAAQLGFEIDKATGDALHALRGRLSLISRERIAAELLRMLASPHAPQVLHLYGDVFLAALPDCTRFDIDALKKAPEGHTLLRTASLLHGDPNAQAVLKSLKLSTAFTEDSLMLIDAYDAKIEPREVPLWLAKMGKERFDALLLLREKQERQTLLKEVRRALDEHLPFSVRDLAINGRDLIAAGLPAGPHIGELLESLHKEVLMRKIPNDRDALLKRIKE